MATELDCNAVELGAPVENPCTVVTLVRYAASQKERLPPLVNKRNFRLPKSQESQTPVSNNNVPDGLLLKTFTSVVLNMLARNEKAAAVAQVIHHR